jgi:hypothetical protein
MDVICGALSSLKRVMGRRRITMLNMKRARAFADGLTVTVLAYAARAWSWLRVSMLQALMQLGLLKTKHRTHHVAVQCVYVFRDGAEQDVAADEETEKDATAEQDAGQVIDNNTEDTGEEIQRAEDEKSISHKIPPSLFNPDTWEADAVKATGWAHVRVEIRYKLRDVKYRLVLRHGDVCEFPPLARHQVKPFIRKAILFGDHGLCVDVTRRVRKYQGPNRDFHGLQVTVKDMFPFDDHAHYELNGVFLSLFDTEDRIADIPYGSDHHVMDGPWESSQKDHELKFCTS